MSVRLGTNIKASYNKEKKVLTLRINLDEKGKPSSTGKTMVIASTGRDAGKNLDEHFGRDFRRMTLGLNLYKAKSKRK